MCPKLDPNARLGLIAALLLMTCGSIVLAQGTKKERVRFQPGRTSAVLRGWVSAKTGREYFVDARKGQRMTVHLAGQKGPVFLIDKPDGSVLSELLIRDWEGELPVSGTYRIFVYAEDDDVPRRSYTLEISVR